MDAQAAYAFFDLSPDSDDQDIVKRYRQLAKAYHPDTHLNSDPEEQDKNERLFKTLTAAQDIILKDRAKNPKRKADSKPNQNAGNYEPPKDFYSKDSVRRDPAEMAAQFQNNIAQARFQRLQKTIDDDYKSMLRGLVFTLATALIGNLSGFWFIYAGTGYFALSTGLIFLDWRDMRDRLKEERTEQNTAS